MEKFLGDPWSKDHLLEIILSENPSVEELASGCRSDRHGFYKKLCQKLGLKGTVYKNKLRVYMALKRYDLFVSIKVTFFLLRLHHIFLLLSHHEVMASIVPNGNLKKKSV